MRKDIAIFISGFVAGSISAYLLERKKKKLLDRILKLEEKLKTLPMKENIKFKVEYILSRLKFSLKNDKNLTEVERDMILKEVKEKIKQIEEWNLG